MVDNECLTDILTTQDYYPFGMLQPGRSYTGDGAGAYRYGFNGKENDNDVGKGEGNQQDYGMRIYNPRVGRFLSVDPITQKYPELTPYQFASNRPVDGIDQDGLEWSKTQDKDGNTNISVNVELNVDKKLNLSDEQISQYKNAINDKLNDVLQQSSGNKVNGNVTFNGGDGNGKLVPILSLTGPNNSIIAGLTGPGYSSVGLFKGDGSLRSIDNVATDAVHELFHTLRLDHPFEKTQGNDTRLIKSSPGHFETTPTTSAGIMYNIMLYPMIYVDNQKLGICGKIKGQA